MYDFDDHDEEGWPWRRAAMVAAGFVAAAAVLWFAVQFFSDDGDGGATQLTGAITSTTAASTTTAAPVTTAAATTTSEPAPSTEATTTAPPTTTARTTTTAATTTTTEAPSPATTVESSESDGGRTSDGGGGQGGEQPGRANPARTTAPPATYSTLPDGSPMPVNAFFDTNSITITGEVPSRAAIEQLEALAVVNAKPGQADVIDNQLTVNRAVPEGVGVRVVELTSERFPPGSDDVLPAHAAELDRMVAVLNALPNVSALVIGHTDQQGEPEWNYELSARRAEAVVAYLAERGISPDRLSSRAVGSNDLLTLEDDRAALELNRRTEFVLYGLLLPG